MSDLVLTSTDGPVRILTLNAPAANCYSFDMMRALDAAILDARFDDSVEAVVLTGAGSKFFCAGADISMLNGVTPTFKYQFCLHANETLQRLEQSDMPVIAALNGHCVGGGYEVAMAADVRFAWRGHGKIGLPEVKLGVLPGTGGTARLTRMVGKAKAMQLMFDATLMDADTALGHGLVEHVVDADDRDAFLAHVVTYAKSLCAPACAPLAVGLIKRSVQSGADMSFADHLALERELQQRLFTSPDAAEGLAAYSEKRKPVFTGKAGAAPDA